MPAEPIFFEINSTDFSANVVRRSYSVQEVDEFVTWVDGNWLTHREIVRTRITGSFNLTFLSEADYQAFLAAVAAAKTSGGYCSIRLWVNTTKQLKTIDAFLQISTKHIWTNEAFGSTPAVAGVTVKIAQR